MRNKELYTRSDSGGEWCSPEYLSIKIGITLHDCEKFLNGPELSTKHALFLTKYQASLLSYTQLTKEDEQKAKI